MSETFGRRLSPRYQTDKIPGVFSIGSGRDLREVDVTLTNIGRKGAQLLGPVPIPLGTKGTLRLEGTDPVGAVVVRCAARDTAYSYGLSLVEPWPAEVFDHLAVKDGHRVPELAERSTQVLPTGCRPIPGMRVVRQIGEGGTGKVVEVVAPGGIVKAAKFVRIDPMNPLSAHELESLQLIGSIQHPFLLAIDRFSVDDDCITIVMELADHNLAEEARRHRERGEPGIPRKRLLGLLMEAAEVLDLLNREYAIQHLDVKPENLFVTAGHLKVGDLGLARRSSASGVVALSPPYAAPELFEGVIQSTSDEYSLAVVYMEMLTGHRPYPGSTVRQVAMYHVTSELDLSPLPEEDRPIIARALSRDPQARFDSCGSLMQALARNSEPMEDERSARAIAPVHHWHRLARYGAVGSLLGLAASVLAIAFAGTPDSGLFTARAGWIFSAPRAHTSLFWSPEEAPPAVTTANSSPPPPVAQAPTPPKPNPFAPAPAPAEPDGAMNVAAKTAPIVAPAGVAALTIELTDIADPVPAGQSIEYALRIENKGTGAAAGVHLALRTSAGLEAIRFEGDLPARIEAGALQFMPFELAAHSSRSCRVWMKAEAPQLNVPLTSSAAADGGQPAGDRPAAPRQTENTEARVAAELRYSGIESSLSVEESTHIDSSSPLVHSLRQ